MTMTEERAAISTATRNNLPDSAFAYIEPGGTKDASGKTEPRSLRHFPIHDAAHVRNALARIAQGAKFGAEASPKVHAAAKKFGIDVSGDRAQHDPAFELRKRRRASMIRQSERRGMLLEVRAKPDGTGGTEFVFEGYGSVFDTPFQMWDRWGEPYTEVVKPGAFTRSLQRSDLDVPFLIGHDESRLALARTKNGTMQLSQDSHGLHVRAQLDGRRSDVRDLAYAVERGDMDEMSIGFVTLGQEWSPDYEVRSMLDMDIHRGDVSPVALAAIPETAGSTVAFPAETLSRRAAMNQAATTDDPDSDHMTPTVAANHGPMTTAGHSHAHPSFDTNAAGVPGSHEHEHSHSNDASHHHLHAEAQEGTDAQYGTGPAGMTGTDADRGSSRPLERRGNPVDQDMGDGPDYNPWKNTPGAMQCTNCSRIQSPAANFCDNCGYGGDALIRINEDGIPPMEEEQGAAASLALKRKRLDLLALAR